jgi:hypothetical protein
MARKPASRTEYVMFDVFYEDGSRRSNRKVPSSVLGGLDLDEPAHAILEEQDRLISEKSRAFLPSRSNEFAEPTARSLGGRLTQASWQSARSNHSSWRLLRPRASRPCGLFTAFANRGDAGTLPVS